MCNMDCFNCGKKDCTLNTVTTEERKAQDAQDTDIRGFYKFGRERVEWDYNHSEKGKAAQRRYAQSGKGKAAKSRYFKSDKGKDAQKRYRQTEQGKATEKRKADKKIASGKNAEYCRRYRERKKAEREAQLCKA